MKLQDDYIFCTLALGSKYHLLAQRMAENLADKSPGHGLVVLTDNPNSFSYLENVIVQPFKQQGVLHCYHDKRFALETALNLANTAIMVDVDACFEVKIPDFVWQPGVEGKTENLLEHVTQYTPERFPHLNAIAEKLDVDIANTVWLGEALFTVTRDQGKEHKFLEVWAQIARYLQLRGIHAGEGLAIGLAAAKVGWQPQQSDSWQQITAIWKHFDASQQTKDITRKQKLQRRLAYHYRLNSERIKALQDFEFYYR
ncbi:MAG: hypothetical protein AAGD25_39255 [Cyanobacteria bacterium P01_F01_bin.150]